MSEPSKASHTPGPWDCFYTGDELWRVYVAGGSPLCDAICSTNCRNDEANARLIAAAPELLHACRDAQAALEHSLKWCAENSLLWKDETAAIETLRAAIKQAEAS